MITIKIINQEHKDDIIYLKNGFVIGGLDTHVYKGTSQENKKDILFYCDVTEETIK